jgi:hypothetical protein
MVPKSPANATGGDSEQFPTNVGWKDLQNDASEDKSSVESGEISVQDDCVDQINEIDGADAAPGSKSGMEYS